MACEAKARRMLEREESKWQTHRQRSFPAMAVRDTDDVKEPIECVLRWLMATEESQDGFSYADGLV